MSESEIYSHLKGLRESFNESPQLELKQFGGTVIIHGDRYTQAAWRDLHGEDELVIFELKLERWRGSKHYCLGLRRNKDGSFEEISNEQLWEMGIP